VIKLLIRSYQNTDRGFFWSFFLLAIPVSLQHVMTTSLGFIDVVMVGKLGQAEIAAVGLVNKIFFLSFIVLSGIASGASVFIAQYWGGIQKSRVKIPFLYSLVIGATLMFPLSLIAWLAPQTFVSLLTEDQQVIGLAREFLSTCAPFFVLTSLVMSLSTLLRSVGSTQKPFYASVVALVINTSLNYLLIFGSFGFPVLGITGAAVATVLSRGVELILLLKFTYFSNGELATLLRTPTQRSENNLPIKKFFALSLPLIASQMVWALGMFVYFLVYSRMGTDELAAITMISPIEGMSIEFMLGLGVAASIVIGQHLGANEKEKAFERAIVIISLAPAAGLIMGSLLMLVREPILSLYDSVNQETYEMAHSLLVVTALTLWIRIFNMITFTGILRSGGDTKFILKLDILGIWFLGVPLALLGGLLWDLPIHLVYCLVTVEELVKSVFFFWRTLSKRWVINFNDLGSGSATA
jgi:putative MATE family efflux protein